MKTMNLADMIIMFVGFYFLVSTAMMKVHGRVNRMLISKSMIPKRQEIFPVLYPVCTYPTLPSA